VSTGYAVDTFPVLAPFSNSVSMYSTRTLMPSLCPKDSWTKFLFASGTLASGGIDGKLSAPVVRSVSRAYNKWFEAELDLHNQPTTLFRFCQALFAVHQNGALVKLFLAINGPERAGDDRVKTRGGKVPPSQYGSAHILYISVFLGHFALLGPHRWTTVAPQDGLLGWRKVMNVHPYS